jgi:hypothetical protein
LFFLSGKPKPYLEGFRFPLVAFPRPGGIYVWGRTPFGRSGRISVEVRNAGAWHSLGTVRTDQFGIFQHVFAAAPTGWVRGRLIGSGERTLPFSLTPVPDQWFNPFGGQALEPKHR